MDVVAYVYQAVPGLTDQQFLQGHVHQVVYMILNRGIETR